MSSLPPGLVLILGSLLFPWLRGGARRAWLLALPVMSALHLFLCFPDGTTLILDLFGLKLIPVRIDSLSMVWGIIFHIAAFLAALYALHLEDPRQHVAAVSYAGAAIGAVFAGDLLTFFVFWELTAVTSVFLVWAADGERASRAGMRYLIVQVASGVLLLAGVVLHVNAGGGLGFNKLVGPDGLLGSAPAGVRLILIAFGIKAAFPLLHNWLQDSYPESTPTGTVYLSTFTTKLAIYALARGFAGTGALMYVGAVMVCFPVFFGVIENDLRRVLCYVLNNQLGYMVVGIGIGTELSINGTASHAFAHILYEGLLFMSMGAVLFRTGTCKASELGGLYKSMPWTTAFCLVGAASISGFPLFSGFVTKSMVADAAGRGHQPWVWLALLFGAVGVFHLAAIKISTFAFFGRDSGRRPKEAPWNMVLAMGLTAALCVGIGCFPATLYSVLPFPVDYEPYTAGHVLAQCQLLFFSALAFAALKRMKIYPPELNAINLDWDWVYRRAAPRVLGSLGSGGLRAWRGLLTQGRNLVDAAIRMSRYLMGPGGVLARTWSTGEMVVWVAALLGIYLLMYFLRQG